MSEYEKDFARFAYKADESNVLMIGSGLEHILTQPEANHKYILSSKVGYAVNVYHSTISLFEALCNSLWQIQSDEYLSIVTSYLKAVEINEKFASAEKDMNKLATMYTQCSHSLSSFFKDPQGARTHLHAIEKLGPTIKEAFSSFLVVIYDVQSVYSLACALYYLDNEQDQKYDELMRQSALYGNIFTALKNYARIELQHKSMYDHYLEIIIDF